MKLVVPYIDRLLPEDISLIRLAEFLGITCEQIVLTRSADYIDFFRSSDIPSKACFVINPEVIKRWLGQDIPPEFGSIITGHFRYCLVHAPHVDAFHTKLITVLSENALLAVQSPEEINATYDIAPDSSDICESFAGLSFGPISHSNDRVFVACDTPFLRKLISIGNNVFMALIKQKSAEVLFVGSENVADLTAKVNEADPTEYFSRFMPLAMALRHIFGEECWRPCEQHASVVVDDPLLRPNYGFLNFDALLNLTKKHNFQTTIAFIPHNYRRNSQRIIKMFRENADRLALCFHGNDHGNAEFATDNTALLNTMLVTAEKRMDVHKQVTSLTCDRVMVFPQGKFSREAMSALKNRNFDAAVNTVSHPKQQKIDLDLCDIAAPAVCRYGKFPLFLRKDSLHTSAVDIAFKLFWGRPVFIVEHHEIFKNPQNLIDAVSRINKVARDVSWSSLGTAVHGSILARQGADGRSQIRAYSRTIRVSNRSNSHQIYCIEWDIATSPEDVEAVLQDGISRDDFQIDNSRINIVTDIGPGMSKELSVVYRSNCAVTVRRDLRIMARAYLRRRFSEVRDNYLSKSPALLGFTKGVQRRFQH